ncbi:DMT family transporter [Trichocoleus sp. FACHB-262]|uniref:DMT family transporter n=1 Tax=Trichocoleus sp. FACHB-262 TaxID=2692869 RepID=UPI00168951EA|nr:DMT family transporter [Trichocoleus sp. FACHB-262]MBD2122105.1 EamA family transporter [Trichocoleus sp. FACHB-262]
MGQLNNTPSEPLRDPLASAEAGEPQTEQTLKAVSQDLKRLHQDLIVQFAQDIARLQAEKSHLIEDIDQLRDQHQQLKADGHEVLGQRQFVQQQTWAKQLAQAIADHWQIFLRQRLNQSTAPVRQPWGQATNANPLSQGSLATNDEISQLLLPLEKAFSTTFKTLQQELDSHQSWLSQQLNRVDSPEQQGEIILSALVQRLREQLQAGENSSAQLLAGDRFTPSLDATSEGRSLTQSSQAINLPFEPRPSSKPEPPLTAPLPSAQGAQEPPTVSPQVKPQAKRPSQVQVGLILVLLSSVALSFHNVVVKVLFRSHEVLGLGQIGGVIMPGLGNSLLILWMRMLIVVPLLALLAPVLYPPMWRDIKRFLLAPDRRPLRNVVGSGGFLFLSQVLIYTALAQIAAGTAITIFFIYPTITVLLAWKIFGDRPTVFRLVVMAVICSGGVLALPQVTGPATGNLWLGSVAAAASGFAFAGYVILTGLCTRMLNPVPVSLIQFVTIFVLSSVVLMFPAQALTVKIQPAMWPGFMLGCLVLGAATLLGYLFTNIGIRLIGAAPASIISATGPAFTAILAWLIIQDQLESRQWFGVLLVTLGVAGLNLERLRGQLKPKSS